MAAGDHIYVERAWGLYHHHGIDCGDGSVIHFQGPDPLRARVKRSPIAAFAAGGDVRRVEDEGPREPRSVTATVSGWIDSWSGRASDAEVDRSAHAVVARAESRLGAGAYDLIFNNCEHFATWCRKGRSHSLQSDRLLSPNGFGLEWTSLAPRLA